MKKVNWLMREGVVPFLLGSVLILSTTLFAREPIPEKWKRFPDIRIVYVLKKDVPAKEGLETIAKGTKVVVSIRQVADMMWRGEIVSPSIALLIVGSSTEQDPGTYDGRIPLDAFADYLSPTSEPRPLTHWQLHRKKEIDTGVPTTKPNHIQNSSFSVTVFPAASISGERPRLIGAGFSGMLVKASPFCLETELTIKLESSASHVRHLIRLRESTPHLTLAGPWFGEYYCIDIKDFLYNFDNGKRREEESPDELSWEEFIEKYHTKRGIGQSVKKTIKVSPYSEEEKKGRWASDIVIYSVASLSEEEKRKLPALVPPNGWIAKYSGPLYYACAGGVCRVQGYQIVFDDTGRLIHFLDNGLYGWTGNEELPLDEQDSMRLMEVGNDRAVLKELYETAKTETGEVYAAKMSGRANQNVFGPLRSGNAYGTFVIHLAKIREKMGWKWPYYTGLAPTNSK